MRIALAYFSFLPLQRWLNWIGIAIWACSLVAGIGLTTGALTSEQRIEPGIAFLGGGSMLAACLIVLTPAFAGGGALRSASTPFILHLRPHGRWRMLLGASIAITLIAALMIVPALILQFSGLRPSGRPGPFSLQYVAAGFVIFWSCTTLLWIVTFFSSRSMLSLLFGAFGTIALVRLVAWSIPQLPFTGYQLTTMLLAIAVTAWTIFASWYMKTPAMLRAGWATSWSSGTTPLAGGQHTGNWFRRFASTNAQDSPDAARRYYLTGAASPIGAVILGAFLTAVLLGFHYLKLARLLPVFQLPLITLFGAATASLMVRRARLLWLRSGLARTALFALSEGHALLVECAVLSVPMVVLVAASMAIKPDLTSSILLFSAAQVATATCFVYAGLSVTRGWTAGSIALFVVLCLLFFVQAGLQPQDGVSPIVHGVALAVSCALIMPLRWHARRRWVTLDWRLAGSPQPYQRRG